jgi:hypothetical protein
MTPLSPIDALAQLDKAAAEIGGSRAVHLHLQECVKIVHAALLDAEAQKKIAATPKDPA